MLTDDQRRMLTAEILKECWHEIVESSDTQWHGTLYKCSCGAIDCEKGSMHRTFTTWQDLGDLKTNIVEMGLWGEFMMVQKRHLYETDNPNGMKKSEWVNWLLDPTRFAELVASWWTERKVKG